MARIIALINNKGGVGKTTSTQAIGLGLHRFHQQKVLLIDLDAQANLTRSCGQFGQEQARTIFHSLTENLPLPMIALAEGLDLVPASLALSLAELRLASRMGREYLLSNLIEPWQGEYDYILIDCPPSLALLSLNAMLAATDVYIPLEPEFLSLYGLDNINITLQEIRQQLRRTISITGVFLTKFSHRVILHQNALQLAQTHFPQALFETKIRRNIALSEAQSQGQSIYDYAPDSHAALDYQELCREIFNRYNP